MHGTQPRIAAAPLPQLATKTAETLNRAVAHARTKTADGKADGDRWDAVKWLTSLQLATLVAEALLKPLGDLSNDPSVQLAYLRELAQGDCLSVVLHVLSESSLATKLAATLVHGMEALSGSRAAIASEYKALASKFISDGDAHEMEFGSLKTFTLGLEGLVGAPDPNLEPAMMREHCKSADSDVFWKTSNYSIQTTSKIEWWFVVDPAHGLAALPELSGGYPTGTRDGAESPRRQQSRQQFEAELERLNKELQAVGSEALQLAELWGACMYTGPCFEKYNWVLRGVKSEVPFVKGRMDSLAHGNKYTTTLHVINSAILKLSRLTQATVVYRGMRGAVLPHWFLKENEYKVRGGVEFAFMSTTRDKGMAQFYSQSSAGTGIIFVIQQGMVDRGADLTTISQYPGEQEILFAPLTGLEVLDTRVEEQQLMIDVRLTCNQASATIEQVVGKRKKLLHDMHRGMGYDLERQLSDTAAHGSTGAIQLRGVVERAQRALETRLLGEVLRRGKEWYNADENFLFSVQQTMQIYRIVVEEAVLECKTGMVNPVEMFRRVAAHADCFLTEVAEAEPDVRSKTITTGWPDVAAFTQEQACTFDRYLPGFVEYARRQQERDEFCMALWAISAREYRLAQRFCESSASPMRSALILARLLHNIANHPSAHKWGGSSEAANALEAFAIAVLDSLEHGSARHLLLEQPGSAAPLERLGHPRGQPQSLLELAVECCMKRFCSHRLFQSVSDELWHGSGRVVLGQGAPFWLVMLQTVVPIVPLLPFKQEGPPWLFIRGMWRIPQVRLAAAVAWNLVLHVLIGAASVQPPCGDLPWLHILVLVWLPGTWLYEVHMASMLKDRTASMGVMIATYFANAGNRMDIVGHSLLLAALALRIVLVQDCDAQLVKAQRGLFAAYWLTGTVRRAQELRSASLAVDVLMVIVSELAHDFLPWAFIVGLTAIGCALALALVTTGSANDFDSAWDGPILAPFWATVSQLGTMTDMETLERDGAIAYVPHILVFLCLCLMQLVAFNLLIAMVADTYSSVKGNAMAEFCYQRAMRLGHYSRPDSLSYIPAPFNVFIPLLRVLCRRRAAIEEDSTASAAPLQLSRLAWPAQTLAHRGGGRALPRCRTNLRTGPNSACTRVRRLDDAKPDDVQLQLRMACTKVVEARRLKELGPYAEVNQRIGELADKVQAEVVERLDQLLSNRGGPSA